MKRNYGWRCDVTTSDFEPFMGEKAAKFTAHAINQHDKLVEAVRLFLAYNDADDDDDVAMMLAYDDALSAAREVLKCESE